MKLSVVRSGDPAREALAAAITAWREADAAATKAQDAAERAQSALRAANVAKDDATDALAVAKAGEADRLTEALSRGEASSAGNAIRNARQRLAEAEDAIEAASAAYDRLKAATDMPAYEARRAKERLDECIRQVLVGQFERLVAEAAALQADLGQRRAVLRYLVGRAADPGASHHDTSVTNFLYALPFPLEGHDLSRIQSAPSVAPWRDAIEALSKDASAALPR
jgi:hypothetical protein